MSIKKFSVEMTIFEARALIDVVGRAHDSGGIEREEAGPIHWVMTRITNKLLQADDQNMEEAGHGNVDQRS